MSGGKKKKKTFVFIFVSTTRLQVLQGMPVKSFKQMFEDVDAEGQYQVKFDAQSWFRTETK